MEIHKTLVVSTAHMTEEDCDLLSEAMYDASLAAMTPVAYEMSEYGWLIYVNPEMMDCADLEQFSDGFKDAIKLAQENGCAYLWFDRDANTLDGLTVYDW